MHPLRVTFRRNAPENGLEFKLSVMAQTVPNRSRAPHVWHQKPADSPPLTSFVPHQ